MPMTSSYRPSFAIIIPTFNCAESLETAISSVVNQDYSGPIELIIIDALSTDNTPSILNRFKSNITRCIIESDEGIYDAWNKGIRASKSDWIIFMGADDCLLEDALSTYEKFIQMSNDEIEYVSANVVLSDSTGYSRVIGKPFIWQKFKHFMKTAHVASIHSKSLFEKYGLFSLDYSICADYDFFLRVGPDLKASYLNHSVAVMTSGGISQSSIKPMLQTRQIKKKYAYLSVFEIEFEFLYSAIIWLILQFKLFIRNLFK
tara:strand:- start:2904 stop:3683 length:780 start_codon:yes stop_codon:yes gene_type:complete